MKRFQALGLGAIFLASTLANAHVPLKCGSFYAEFEPFYARIDDRFQSIAFAHDFFDCCPRSSDHHSFRNWGFRAAIGYDYINCKPCYYGWSLEYTRLHANKQEGIATSPTGSIVTRGGFAGVFSSESELRNLNYDTVDLLGHWHRCLSPCFEGEAFGGLAFLRLKERLNATFNASPFYSFYNPVLNRHLESKYEGLGFRAGIKGDYLIWRGLGATGQLAGDLLIGSQEEVDNNYFTEAGIIGFTADDNFDEKYRNKVVPAVSGKLGLTYHACFNCRSLEVEAGYRIDRYFNVLKTPVTNASCSCVSVPRSSKRDDFEFNGPYLSLAVHF